MDLNYTEEQLMMKDMARKFAENELWPVVGEYDDKHIYPEDIYEKLFDTGLATIGVPAEFGGAGIDFLGQGLITEEIARGCLGVATAMVASTLLATDPIHIAANDDQKQRWFTKMLEENKFAAFCLTEPGAGSDVGGMSTTCKKTDGGYILNGVKCFITNGGVANQYTIFATLDKKLGVKGICAFMVDRNSEGISVGKTENKLGIRLSNTAEVVFDNVFVPEENRLGEEGTGWMTAMKTLDWSRPMIAALAVGCAQGAFHHAVEYSKIRTQFGKPISSFQAVQFLLADAAMDIEAGRLLYHKACALKMDKKPFSQAASIAKGWCGDMAMRVTTDMVQVFGGYGYSKEYPVEKYMRDAKILQIYEGTSQIQRIVVAANLLKGLR
ncbi:MAG: acyl-CoA dehydrogenase family protein [Syntrophomonadaceae bacterium]|nr:acyl-CoA dehydrogenase family protein [Syntrophomonadaceae bacterium]MDD3890491.1 acyl-CoA dehydrogenase family protein [Syntrophomonadaceae bacterium]